MLKNLIFALCVAMSLIPADAASYRTQSAWKTKIGSETWIEQKVRQYPELLWLTDPSGVAASPSSGQTFSTSIFEKNVPAFDTAIRSLIYLHLLLQGSRHAYGQIVLMGTSMTFKQFQSIHKQLNRFLNSPKNFDDALKILETAIVLKPLGYSTKAVSLFRPYFSDPNPSTFYSKALQVLRTFPNLCPSFARLSSDQREAFCSLRKLMDYSALLDLTAPPNSTFLTIGRSQRPLLVLDLYLHALDRYGSGDYSSEFHLTFTPLIQLLNQHATIEEAFSRYLNYRAHQLGIEGNSRHDLALVRLATLMGLSPSEISGLYWSFHDLPKDAADLLVDHFYSSQGEYLTLSILGLPRLVEDLFQASQLPTTQEGRFRQAYSTALSLIIKGLEAHKDMLNKKILPNGTVLDFSETIASSGGIDVFSENTSIRIHLDGTVSINL